MIDSKKILYLPLWVKVVTVAALLVCLTVSITISIAFIGVPQHTDWILVSMALAQLSATALLISLTVIFGEREANIDILKTKTDQFLTQHAPKVLRRIEDNDGDNPEIDISAPNNIFGVNYILKTSGAQMKMWLGLNVDRVIVIYFIKGISVEEAKNIYKYTFGGAETVGYNINYETTMLPKNNEEIISIWCTWPKIQNADNLATDLLNHPEKKLFIIQDIAMMTQSFMRTSQRAKVNIFTDGNPGPL